jgi:hypothetical protein
MRNDRKYNSRFWSDSFIIPKDEQEQLDSWFYEHLFSIDQYELTLDFFNSQKTLFQRDLQGNSIIEFLLFAKGKPFNLSPKDIDDKLRERILELKYNKEVYWFTCYQSQTYHHDLGPFGIYSFERHSDNSDVNGELFPVFDNFIDHKIGQDLVTCK